MKQKLILTEIFVKKCRVTSKKLRPTASVSSPPPKGSGDPAKNSEEKANDPPLPDVSSTPEALVSLEIGIDAPAANIAQQPDIPTPPSVLEPRLPEAAVVPPSSNTEEGTAANAEATAPNSSAALGKSPIEAMSSKGKDKLDLSSLEDIDLGGLHEALLTRLSESQEIASVLANKPKVSHKH
jgi:hypothetical protein